MKGLALISVFLTCVHHAAVDAVITYQLYTKMNPKMGQPLIYKNINSINKSYFNSAKKNKWADDNIVSFTAVIELHISRMIIHGYGQNGRADFNRDLKDALLSHDDYNVIVGNDCLSIFNQTHELNTNFSWLLNCSRVKLHFGN